MKPTVVLLAAALLTPMASPAVNLVVNGGFESPALAGADVQLNVSPSGWTGFGDIVRQGYSGSVASGEGNQWLDLNPGTGGGTMEQTVHLEGSPTYVFSFLYNGGVSGPGRTTAITWYLSTPTSFIAAGVVATESMNVFNGTPWARFTNVMALGPDPRDMTIRFEPNGIGENGFIDGVSVIAIPEPATIGLIGVGLLGMLGWLKRRTSTATNPSKV